LKAIIAAPLRKAPRAAITDDIGECPRLDVGCRLAQHGGATLAPFFVDVVDSTIIGAAIDHGSCHACRHGRPVHNACVD
jgi:hypothetical protein